jgi:hypothetical protein
MEGQASATPSSQAETWEEPRIWVVLDLRHSPSSTPAPAGSR